MQKKALIYADKGSAQHSVNLTIKALKDFGISTQPVFAQDIIEKKWEKDTVLFIMPGGRDIFFHTLLSGKGNNKIRQFVKNGGFYLGLCAGAYYGCESIEFEKGSSLEITGKRELGFFPNKATGPALGNGLFQYNSEIGAQAALIHYSSKNITAQAYLYYNGGCTFENPKEHKHINILGHFNDKKMAAILEINFGKGKAILSGVHLEYSHEHLDQKNIHLKKIIPLFKKTEHFRKKILADVISKFFP